MSPDVLAPLLLLAGSYWSLFYITRPRPPSIPAWALIRASAILSCILGPVSIAAPRSIVDYYPWADWELLCFAVGIANQITLFLAIMAMQPGNSRLKRVSLRLVGG